MYYFKQVYPLFRLTRLSTSKTHPLKLLWKVCLLKKVHHPGGTQTCILWCRKPTPLLGHRATCNAFSNFRLNQMISNLRQFRLTVCMDQNLWKLKISTSAAQTFSRCPKVLEHAYMHYLLNNAHKETRYNTHRLIPSNGVSVTMLFDRRSHWSAPWNENPHWWKDNLSTLPKVILEDCRSAKTKLNIPKVDRILSLLSVLETDNHHKQPMVIRNEKTIILQTWNLTLMAFM